MTPKIKEKQSALTRLLKSLKKQRTLIVVATSFSVLNKIFDLAPPVLIGLSVDVIAREQNSFISTLGIRSVPSQLWLLAIVSFFIWSAESLFEYLYGLLWRNLAQSTQNTLRVNAYKHLQELEMSFFEFDNSGRLMSILNDDINQLERFLDHGANQIIQLIVTVLIIGSAMTVMAPGVALLAFIPIPIILVGSINFQKKLMPRYREVREKAGDLSSRLNNNLGGMLTIKSFATESLELKRLSQESESYRKSNQKAIKLSAAFIPLIRFAILFAFLAILVVGGIQTWKGQMVIGTYSFLVFITQRLLWPLTTLGHTLDDYQRSMASTNRVLDLIDVPINIISGPTRIKKENIIGNIEFKSVCFNYKERKQLFNNFNLKIPTGKTLGIVGLTGSGKSTLVKLLLRLYPISSGEILIDGISIENYNLKDLRRSIALVSQDVYLFHGTILENIAYGSKNLDFEKIKEAAKLAESNNFIEALPNGYKTLVGERGQRLSGGQRQRIALARAILKDAPILILDEATAAVDNETEAAIKRSLAKITKNRTTLIIAHRLSTIRNAEKILVLSEGKVAEIGDHNSLINKGGKYSELWQVQAGLEVDETNNN